MNDAPSLPAAPTALPVELYYIDLATCDRCQGADSALDEALALVEPALAALGLTVRVTRRLVATAAEAEALRIPGSPTLRIAGRDIQPVPRQSSCAACSSVAGGEDIECREWLWRGQIFSSPPTGLIVEEMLRAAITPAQAAEPRQPFRLPENLARFFAAKEAAPGAKGCGCGCN